MKKALISLLIVGVLSVNILPSFTINAGTTTTIEQSISKVDGYESYLNNKPIAEYKYSTEFNGTSTLYNKNEDVDKFKNLSEGTVAIKFKTNISNKTQTLFTVSNNNETNSYFEIKMVDGKFRLETMENNQKKLAYTVEDKNYADGNWHTIVLSGGELGGVLYVDGDKVVEEKNFNNIFMSVVEGLNCVTVGAKTTSAGTGNYFNGNIEYVEVYNKQFSHEYSSKYSLNDYRDILAKLHNTNESSTILFAGDSITHGVHHTHGYRSYSEHLKERLREINEKNFIINTGSSSATTNDAIKMYEKWIGVYKADIVFVTFGMNDCTAKGMTTDKYKDNLKTIIDDIRKQEGIPILQAINVTKGDREPNLSNYMKALRELAKEKNVILIDHNSYWSKLGKSVTNEWLNDSIHPNGKGQIELTKLILRDLKLDTDNSPTANLEWPLELGNKEKRVIENYSVVNGEEPVLSYKVNKTFDGKTGDDKSKEDIEKIKDMESGSIVARFKLTANDNKAKTIISLSNNKEASREIALGVKPDGSIFCNGRVDNKETNVFTEQGGFNDGKWHTVVVNANNNKIELYVDGEKLAVNEGQKFFGGLDNPTNLSIGKNVHNTGNEWFFNGDISFVDIYRKTLTTEQISEVSKIKENTKGNFSKLIERATTSGTDNSWVLIGDNSTSGNGATAGHKNYGEYLEENIRWEIDGNDIYEKARHVINAGIDNTNSKEVNDNFTNWIGRYNPEIVSIMLGENENCTVNEFKANLKSIIDKSKALKAEVLLQTPVTSKSNIEQYVNAILEVADSEEIPVIDHYNEWKDLRANNPHLNETYFTEDGEVNYRGHIKIARDIMEALGILDMTKPSSGIEVEMNYID